MVYTGRKERSEQGLGYRVVRDLTADLKGRNHQVYCDNFFTTTNLVEDLAADNIFACGTARKDRRRFPSVLKEVRLKNRYGPPHTHTQHSHLLYCVRLLTCIIIHNNYYTCTFNSGDMATAQKGQMSVSIWMDRKAVTVMSSSTQPGEVQRRQKDGSKISVPCPAAIVTYNRFMAGVDRGDQLRGYYSCRTKSRKFYRYIFHFLFDVSVTNAFILWKYFSQGW